ncbi:tetratricopeptide repeat protein [Saccharothrix saharensis]|uniref:Tetratricopeptide repeat protein n=1 Tax=Saccharothrix saharensis TaxID=571190 RepID=A0A543JCA2_9PSEU|nr:NACHT domain-containing protein [Saccharothrix saharensis]TQM80479.1 tetratricopeptide repeat protein [Saccharothrix saharensis]
MRLPGRLAWWAAAAAVVSAALAVAVNIATDTVEAVDRPWWPAVAWSAVGLLVVLGVVVQSSVERRRAASASPEPGDVLRTVLDGVREAWTGEAAKRKLLQPAPLDVRWSSTERPVAADRRTVLDDPDGPGWHDAPLTGGVGQVADALPALPHRQLVVLGAPGAGKSALAVLLTLGLVDRHAAGEPVPVLLAVSSWNPAVEEVEDFLVRRTAEDHAVDAETVRRLVRDGLVLPVLDGLDEVPAVWHEQALRKLERWTVAKRPLVLTCRSEEYERAVTSSGIVLGRAAVVELAPVDGSRVGSFLATGTPVPQRWEPVLRHLEAEPGGVLAEVLSTPLMVSIARSAYRSATTDPAALLRLADRAAVARTLFDAFLADAYPPAEPDPTAVRPAPPRPRKAVKWLRYLAFQLHQAGTRDWHWWNVSPKHTAPSPSPRRWMAGATLVILPVAVVVVALWGFFAPFGPASAEDRLTLGMQIVFGVVAICIMFVIFSLRSHLASLLAAGGTYLVGSGVAVLIEQFLTSDREVGALGVMLTVTVVSYEVLARIPLWVQSGSKVVTVLRDRFVDGDRRVVCGVFGAAFCVVAGAAVQNRAVFVSAAAYAVIAAVMPVPTRAWRSSFTPWATMSAAWRRSLAAAARHGALGGTLVAVAVAWTSTPSAIIRAAAVAAVCCGLNAAYWAGLRSLAWYRCVVVANAMLGIGPWRPRRFLNEARNLQVLRQAGTALQFRHALLQDHLEEPVRVEHLTTLVEQDDYMSEYAVVSLAEAMARRGDVAEAITLLRDTVPQFYLSDPTAKPLADLLAAEGRLDELREMAAELPGTRGHEAGMALARALVAAGRVDEAIPVLRAGLWHGLGAEEAAEELVGLLAHHGRLAEIRVLTYGEDLLAVVAAGWLSTHSADEPLDHVVDFLRSHLDDEVVVFHDGRVKLADLLARTGREAEALAVLRDGADRPHPTQENVAWRLAALLAEAGEWAELRERADADDICVGAHATRLLAADLAARGDVEEAVALMRARLERDDRALRRMDFDAEYANLLHGNTTALLLADLLVEVGRVDEAAAFLARRLKLDHEHAMWDVEDMLVDVLLGLGRLDDAVGVLRTMMNRVDPHSEQAAARLAALSEAGR